MSDTIRERIISAYMTRMAAILIASESYYTSIGSNVCRADNDVDLEALPACVLWPGIEKAERRYGQVVCEMPLKIEGLMLHGAVNQSVIQERMLGDIIFCMTNTTVAQTTLIESVQYTGGGPAVATGHEDTITAVYADFVIKYQTDAGNPYSQ